MPSSSSIASSRRGDYDSFSAAYANGNGNGVGESQGSNGGVMDEEEVAALERELEALRETVSTLQGGAGEGRGGGGRGGPVGVFWDESTFPLPSTSYDAFLSRLKSHLSPLVSGPIILTKLYASSMEAFQSCQTASVRPARISGMVGDICLHAMDQGRATVVLLSRDEELAYTMAALRDRHHEVILVTRTETIPDSLRYAASRILHLPMSKKLNSSSTVPSSASSSYSPKPINSIAKAAVTSSPSLSSQSLLSNSLLPPSSTRSNVPASTPTSSAEYVPVSADEAVVEPQEDMGMEVDNAMDMDLDYLDSLSSQYHQQPVSASTVFSLSNLSQTTPIVAAPSTAAKESDFMSVSGSDPNILISFDDFDFAPTTATTTKPASSVPTFPQPSSSTTSSLLFTTATEDESSSLAFSAPASASPALPVPQPTPTAPAAPTPTSAAPAAADPTTSLSSLPLSISHYFSAAASPASSAQDALPLPPPSPTTNDSSPKSPTSTGSSTPSGLGTGGGGASTASSPPASPPPPPVPPFSLLEQSIFKSTSSAAGSGGGAEEEPPSKDTVFCTEFASSLERDEAKSGAAVVGSSISSTSPKSSSSSPSTSASSSPAKLAPPPSLPPAPALASAPTSPPKPVVHPPSLSAPRIDDPAPLPTPDAASLSLPPSLRPFLPLVQSIVKRSRLTGTKAVIQTSLVLPNRAALYQQSGTTRFSEYLAKAVASGCVKVGDGDRVGREWVMVRHPLPPAMTALLGGGVGGSSSESTGAGGGRTSSARGTPRSSSASSTSNTPTNTIEPSADDQRNFFPLIKFLSSLPSSPPPLRGMVSQNLPSRKLSFQMAQCSGWSEYAQKAERLGFVELGIDGEMGGGVDWIRLVPKWRVITPAWSWSGVTASGGASGSSQAARALYNSSPSPQSTMMLDTTPHMQARSISTSPVRSAPPPLPPHASSSTSTSTSTSTISHPPPLAAPSAPIRIPPPSLPLSSSHSHSSKPVPPQSITASSFLPLVRTLRSFPDCRASPMEFAQSRLESLSPGAYDLAGIKQGLNARRWNAYCQRAEEMGVVELDWEDGIALTQMAMML